MAKGRTSAQVEAIFGGLTVTDLRHIFGGSQNDIHKKIGGRVQPCSPIGEEPIRYRLRDVVPYLVDQKVTAREVEQAIMKMTPAKLPPALQAAFWSSQITQQEFWEKRGELWATQQVVTILGEAFKPLAMTLRLLADTVSQESVLSEEQREIITRIADGALQSLHDALIDKFKDYQPAPDEHGRPIFEQDEAVQLDITPTEEDDGFGEQEEDDGFGG